MLIPAIIQVSQRSIHLNNMDVLVQGCGTLTIRQMQQNSKFTLLLVSLPVTTLVFPAGAVIGYSDRELINVGSYVQFSTGFDEVGL